MIVAPSRVPIAGVPIIRSPTDHDDAVVTLCPPTLIVPLGRIVAKRSILRALPVLGSLNSSVLLERHSRRNFGFRFIWQIEVLRLHLRARGTNRRHWRACSGCLSNFRWLAGSLSLADLRWLASFLCLSNLRWLAGSLSLSNLRWLAGSLSLSNLRWLAGFLCLSDLRWLAGSLCLADFRWLASSRWFACSRWFADLRWLACRFARRWRNLSCLRRLFLFLLFFFPFFLTKREGRKRETAN